jgi:hypothetical protein
MPPSDPRATGGAGEGNLVACEVFPAIDRAIGGGALGALGAGGEYGGTCCEAGAQEALKLGAGPASASAAPAATNKSALACAVGGDPGGGGALGGGWCVPQSRQYCCPSCNTPSHVGEVHSGMWCR